MRNIEEDFAYVNTLAQTGDIVIVRDVILDIAEEVLKKEAGFTEKEAHWYARRFFSVLGSFAYGPEDEAIECYESLETATEKIKEHRDVVEFLWQYHKVFPHTLMD